jgi:hypothetical protein
MVISVKSEVSGYEVGDPTLDRWRVDREFTRSAASEMPIGYGREDC